MQAGVDIPFGDKGMGLSLDANKYWVNTTRHVRNAAGTEVLETEHKIAPWVVSARIAYRF